MKHLTVALILGLASLFVAYPAIAQSPETTASEVVDRETLQAFVEGAKARMESISGSNAIASFLSTLSIEGDWKHGNTYIILMGGDGTVFFHADDKNARSKNLHDMEDDRGNKVVQTLIETANAGGGFVEYYWDDPTQEGDEDTPKIAYATSKTFSSAGLPWILIGGYYQDVSQVSLPPLDPSIVLVPEVTAADVVDRETLKAFVQGALESYLTLLKQIGLERFLQQRAIFREEGSPWRQDPIYFFCFSPDGYVFFHGVDLSLELNTSDLDKEDVNGVKYLRELIRVAKEGGGFVQYNFDDPAVEGDEDTGSPKVSYAEFFTFLDLEFVLGAGFYTGAAATAVEEPSWGQLKSDF